ncbi:MAG TPA: glycosyltransferase [Candidatus Acidoferrales bacterium]
MISAIIPARNEEAAIARAVESLAGQPEVAEVIVVDDQSSDGTAAVLRDLAARIAKLKVIAAGELPRGWVGKNHAAAVGAEAAIGDWLLFTDADTFHLPGSARKALCDAVDHNAALVSYSPEQEMATFWERALIPFVYCRLAARFSFARINDPKLPDAAANGQFLMIRRDAYDVVGGHAAVAAEILEDVALARRVKQRGFGIYFAAPSEVVRTRMYRSLGAMWQGWTKNLYPLMGASFGSLLFELLEASPLIELAVLLAILALGLAGFRSDLLLPAAGVVAGMLLSRNILHLGALRRNRYPVSYIKYYFTGAALYAAALLESWWKSTHGGVVWKGRTYPAGAR